MKPSAARRVERQLREIMQKDGDNCSICRADFAHNRKTFGGLTAGGIAALVGECCASKLRDTLIAGVFTTRGDYGIQSTGRHVPDADIPGAVTALQELIETGDAEGRKIARAAGMPGVSPRLDMSDNIWKADDALWFSANPARSHRLRRQFPGETFGDALPSAPLGYEFQVLVKQTQPGMRLRTPFCRSLIVPMPDIEPLIHALFDLNASAPGRAISILELVGLAKRYTATGTH